MCVWLVCVHLYAKNSWFYLVCMVIICARCLCMVSVILCDNVKVCVCD